MKRFLALLLAVLCLTVSLSVCVSADALLVSVYIDDQWVEFDVPPLLNGGRTLVPMRAVFEALGAEVTWDNDTNTATAVKENTVLKITVGADYMYKNDELIPLHVGSVLLNDRTLVPLRAVSEAFGCRVYWNDETYTVNIYSEGYNTITDAEYEKVEVSTIDELLNAIGNNRELVLTADSYNFSNAKEVSNDFVAKRENYYGYQWTIHSVNNLRITGNAEVLTDDIMSHVLYFDNCKNITIDGITAGHTQGKEQYECEGAVTRFDNCENVALTNCNLFGCGAEGIYAYNTYGLTAENCKIYECTYSGIWLTSTKNAVITNCEIYDCGLMSGFCRLDNSQAEFVGCNIHDVASGHYLLDSFDSTGEPSYISLTNCTIENNTFHLLSNINTVFTDCIFKNNDSSVDDVYFYDTYDYIEFENCTFE